MLEGKNNFKKLDQFQMSNELQCGRGLDSFYLSCSKEKKIL